MEKRLSVAVKKIVGQPNPKEGKWSDVLVFGPEDGRIKDAQLQKSRGRLFAVLDLTGSSALGLAQFGKLVLETLREEYYASEEASPLQALEEAIHKAQHRLVELVFGPGGAVPDSALNYNFAAAVLWGTVLYLAKFGASSIYLYRPAERDNRHAQRGAAIEELGEAEDERVFSASGMVRDGDVVVLGSSDFRRTFSVGELPEAVDNLESLVSNLGNPPGISGMVLRFGLESVPGEEEEVVVAPVVRGKSFFEKLRSRLPWRRLALLVLVALFLSASVFTVKKRQADFRAAKTEQLVRQAEQTLSDAKQYVDLNNSRAREKLKEARENFEAAKGAGSEILGLSKKMEEIDTLLDQVNKVKRVKPEIVEGAAVSFDPLSELDSPPEVGDSVVDTGTYFGNVYFLVPPENQILKSVPAGGGYSVAVGWLESEVDISDAVSMTVDGFIYVLKSDGGVLKFEKGELVSDFGLKELDLPLSDPSAIFTTIDSERLYILDAGNKRIVATDKNGLYQSQYVYGEGLTDPKDLFVDEAAGMIYILDGTKIFRIGM